MRGDDDKEVAHADLSVGGEDVHGDLREHGGDETADEGPGPEFHGREDAAPFTGVVAEADFEGEVDEDGEGEVFLGEAFVEEFEVGNGVVGLETDFGD